MTLTKTNECNHCYREGAHDERCPLRHCAELPVAPIVHLNGTGWKDLYAQTEAAVDAIQAAIKAMCAGGPNARDYYVGPVGAWEKARDQHDSRVKRLLEVKAELEHIWIAISNQERR